MKLYYKIIAILVIISLLVYLKPVWIGPYNAIFVVIKNLSFAFAIAYVTYPIKKKLVEFRLPKSLASLLTVLILVSFIVLLGIMILPVAYEQLINLNNLIQNSNETLTLLKNKPELTQVFDLIRPYISGITKDTITVVSNILGGIYSFSANIIGSSIIIFFFYLYIISEFEKIVIVIKKKLDPERKRYQFIKKLNIEYMLYIKGLVTITVIMFFIYGVSYYLMGHPYWATLTVLGLFTEVVPIIAGVAINTLALITAAFHDQRLFYSVLILTLILPNIEGNILHPLILKKSISIHPVIILASVFIGNNLFGVIGVIIAMPTIICYKVFKNTYGEDIKKLFLNFIEK